MISQTLVTQQATQAFDFVALPNWKLLCPGIKSEVSKKKYAHFKIIGNIVFGVVLASQNSGLGAVVVPFLSTL